MNFLCINFVIGGYPSALTTTVVGSSPPFIFVVYGKVTFLCIFPSINNEADLTSDIVLKVTFFFAPPKIDAHDVSNNETTMMANKGNFVFIDLDYLVKQ